MWEITTTDTVDGWFYKGMIPVADREFTAHLEKLQER